MVIRYIYTPLKGNIVNNGKLADKSCYDILLKK